MTKYNSAYILSHNGLGDNITMIGAINYLLLHYNNVYFLCKDIYLSNVKLLLNNPNIIILPFDHTNEYSLCQSIINNIPHDKFTDIFICGCHKSYLKSNINNPSILTYKKNNKYDIQWSHVKGFYQDMNLDLSIYYDYFDINSSEKSTTNYEKIKNLNIIFCHTDSSTEKIILPENIKSYINDNKYIIVCANENVYDKNHTYFELANTFINIPVQEYIDVIKHACEIFVIDSCFCAIIHPLSVSNKLNTAKIEYIRR